MTAANPNNNLRLKKIIREHPGMTRRWIAEQLHVTPSTVDRWLVPKTISGQPNPTFRKMPTMAIDLLNYRLKDTAVIGW